MNLPELQSCLDRLGVKLSLRLVVDAPTGALTPEIKSALVNHKPDLLSRLAGVGFQSESAPPRAGEMMSSQCGDSGIVRSNTGIVTDSAAMPTSFALFGAADLTDDYVRQERAAIMEFDGGLTRAVAERAAGQHIDNGT
jgi:hypothetical protein